MAKTAKLRKLDTRRERPQNFFTRAVTTLLDSRQAEFERGKWREVGNAAELKPARKITRSSR